MRIDRITDDVWQTAEDAFLEDLKKHGYDAEKAEKKYDMSYHTDIWLKNNELLYSIDVKNFSFQFGLFGFYFAHSHSQWGNSQARKLKEREGIDIAGEYIVIPYVKDDKPVWAIIDRSSLGKKINEIKPFNPLKVHQGNPNNNSLLRAGKIQPTPLVWWQKQQAPSYGEPVETRVGIHVDKETFEKLVLTYLDRSMLIKSPSGGKR